MDHSATYAQIGLLEKMRQDDQFHRKSSSVTKLSGSMPFFFVDDGGRHVSVNGDRYRAINYRLFFRLEYMDLDGMGFNRTVPQATRHGTIDLLKNKFDDVLSQEMDQSFGPPR
ncbi:hypothetical protein TNIN_194471 [Trichonephila inaurata madagascariensis]|uniref:Uncharacterized protein n=1 Tax=Trichonephila inaurata madagascariensis TaxID=2747483 RepID=A0A8X6WV27_9ARAC|nr:hypothetical protein TNIN_194471 [Trichonephila inaurata madagascariensis]